MTPDVFVYEVKLPKSISEVVTPCLDGYTIYLNSSLSDERKIRAYNHAIKHIEGNDFEKSDVQAIEKECHSE